MPVNEKDFFREATIRICSNLKIEEVLQSCFLYLRNYITISKMYLHLKFIDQPSMKFIARASLEKAEQLDISMPVP